MGSGWWGRQGASELLDLERLRGNRAVEMTGCVQIALFRVPVWKLDAGNCRGASELLNSESLRENRAVKMMERVRIARFRETAWKPNGWNGRSVFLKYWKNGSDISAWTMYNLAILSFPRTWRTGNHRSASWTSPVHLHCLRMLFCQMICE